MTQATRARKTGVLRGWASIAVSVAVAGVMGPWTAQSQERVAEKVVWGAYEFGKVHGVMKSLRGTLEAAVRGFLIGDEEAIRRSAETIAADLGEISGAFPTRSADEEEALHGTLQAMVDEAHGMQERIREGRYTDAHDHLSRLTRQCIVCHQARRVYGRFQE